MRDTREKLISLLYKITKTTHPRTPGSYYIGGMRMADVPQCLDDFIHLWHTEYDKRMKQFGLFRGLVERRFVNERFIKYSEYLEIFERSRIATASGIDEKITDVMIRYPAYQLAGIKNEKARQEFLMNYVPTPESYFALMKKLNPTLYTIMHEWHDVAIKQEDRLHTWVSGTTGVGKSELIKSMILQDLKTNMQQDASMVIFDPNGDFAEEIAKFKEFTDPVMRDKLVYIDLDLFNGVHTPIINPFDIDLDTSQEEIDRIADLTNQQISAALEEICNSFGQPLTSQMQAILYNLTHVLLHRKNSTFWDLHTLVHPAKNHPPAVKLVQEGKDSTNPGTRGFFRDTWEVVPSFKDSKAGIYMKTLRLMNMPSFANLISGESTVKLGKLIEENKIIIFNLAIGKLGDQAPKFIGQILISLLQSIVFQRASIEKTKRKPLYLYIDEFSHFVTPSVMNILTQGRKYKTYLTVVNQFVGQGMSTEQLDTILGNTKIKLMGNNSNKSHNVMAKETDAEVEIMKKLKVGTFMCKIGEGEAFVLSGSTKSLNNTNSMSEQERQAIIEDQKDKYYKYKPVSAVLESMMEYEAQGPFSTIPEDKTTVKPRNNAGKGKRQQDIDFEPAIPEDI
ncbi:hypothetical protein [Microcystis phage Mwe-JY31]